MIFPACRRGLDEIYFRMKISSERVISDRADGA